MMDDCSCSLCEATDRMVEMLNCEHCQADRQRESEYYDRRMLALGGLAAPPEKEVVVPEDFWAAHLAHIEVEA